MRGIQWGCRRACVLPRVCRTWLCKYVIGIKPHSPRIAGRYEAPHWFAEVSKAKKHPKFDKRAMLPWYRLSYPLESEVTHG